MNNFFLFAFSTQIMILWLFSSTQSLWLPIPNHFHCKLKNLVCFIASTSSGHCICLTIPAIILWAYPNSIPSFFQKHIHEQEYCSDQNYRQYSRYWHINAIIIFVRPLFFSHQLLITCILYLLLSTNLPLTGNHHNDWRSVSWVLTAHSPPLNRYKCNCVLPMYSFHIYWFWNSFLIISIIQYDNTRLQLPDVSVLITLNNLSETIIILSAFILFHL